jgi:hypothetical protein
MHYVVDSVAGLLVGIAIPLLLERRRRRLAG